MQVTTWVIWAQNKMAYKYGKTETYIYIYDLCVVHLPASIFCTQSTFQQTSTGPTQSLQISGDTPAS